MRSEVPLTRKKKCYVNECRRLPDRPGQRRRSGVHTRAGHTVRSLRCETDCRPSMRECMAVCPECRPFMPDWNAACWRRRFRALTVSPSGRTWPMYTRRKRVSALSPLPGCGTICWPYWQRNSRTDNSEIGEMQGDADACRWMWQGSALSGSMRQCEVEHEGIRASGAVLWDRSDGHHSSFQLYQMVWIRKNLVYEWDRGGLCGNGEAGNRQSCSGGTLCL